MPALRRRAAPASTRVVMLAGLLTLALSPTAALAQVFGSGPSDPSLFTNGVFNVPRDSAPRLLRDLQQLNVAEGGSVDRFFGALSGSEVNVRGGTVGFGFGAFPGSEVNISGGSVGDRFEVFPGSNVNISGGSVGNFFETHSGTEVNISGGSIGNFFSASDNDVSIGGGSVGDSFLARSGSKVNISGGIFGDDFLAQSGSEVNFLGTEFFLNDEPIDGLTVGVASEILDRDLTNSGLLVLSGTLMDGSAFDFDLNIGVSFPSVVEFFSPGATLTVTLIPEPAAGGLLVVGAIAGALRRRSPRTAA